MLTIVDRRQFNERPCGFYKDPTNAQRGRISSRSTRCTACLRENGCRNADIASQSDSAYRSRTNEAFDERHGFRCDTRKNMALCIRKIGIARTRVKIGLANLTYSIRRLVFIATTA